MNYGELKNAVVAWLDHSDSDDTATFVELARAKINRKLRTMKMVCVAHATGDGEKVGFDLPIDWGGARQVSVGRKSVNFADPGRFKDYSAGVVATPPSDYGIYTIRAGEILIYPTVPDGTDIELAYYRKVPQLVEDEDTNWLLEDHADAWLYGAVAEAHDFVMDDPRNRHYTEKMYGVLEEIRLEDWNDRWSGGRLRETK